MKNMVKTGPSGQGTNDPRLDGGASIKSLLEQYREVKKGQAMDSGGDSDKIGSIASPSTKRKGPPPPPPRRKNKDDAGDGLAEFTIV